ncbi:hypothetical protein QQS21_002638 [Conoideocrella luteorostrata]|uniref:Uncharacterized protein n=1 Tax=Conoideocrella luteorostrata TaxID=1105319 RepID=A0AAJ0G2S9_9HYPO|nr:hypothetical protein QQS21_002638 [Conoideocrella luteorostrata]
MRLLNRDHEGKYSLKQYFPTDQVPQYAILSHTWGSDEVVFADLAKPSAEWRRKAGYRKIEFCAGQAERHGLQFFWVDTCCIDKSDSIELQTAINSMFRWYRDAKRCYVYLSDVSNPTASSQQSIYQWDRAFRDSKWFTRGWTLQELIAPKAVDFYSKEGAWLGDKHSLEPIVRDITGIPASALRGTPLSNFPILEREAWVRDRQTTYEEDMAYSLLGIFDVHMPLIYGEGREKAMGRLQEEARRIVKGARTNDFSITFSLFKVPEIQYFVAREKEISEVRELLRTDGSRRAVTLQGLGGIGKTQLAVEYAKRYRDEYSAIFWFNIKDKASILQSFTKVASQILQEHPNASGLSALNLQQNPNEVVEAVRIWLSLSGNTRWLIVFDNYDNPSLNDHIGININNFLPTAYQGSIIITTRLSQVDIGHSVRIRKLESMEDSLKILSLTSCRGGLHIDINAKKLIEKLDGLPLALVTAGTYLKRVPISLIDYLRYYEKSWARLHMNIPRLGSYEDRTLCSTWKISYEQVQEQNPLAAHLLQWWAYFNNEDIWFELLQPVDKDGPAWIYDLADELTFNKAMGTLYDYGFVEHTLYTSSSDLIESRGYSIHSCLHAWTLHILNQKSDGYLQKLAIKCVASRVPSQDENQFWLLKRRLLLHALVSCAIIQNNDEGLDRAFHRLGNLFMDQDKLQEAEEMYLRALQGFEKTWGPDHTSTLDTVYSLGILYKNQGKLQEAEEMFLRALQGKEKAWGPDHTLTLDTVNSLGVLYANQGKLQEAEEILGVLYMDQDKLQEAEEMYLRALQGKEKALGPDHTLTLDTVNSLGVLYANQGKLQEAKEMFLRALQGKEKAWGPDHTSTLATVNSLGVLYMDQDKLQEAEEMYLRALQGKEKALGPDHTSTLATVNNLGILYANQGKLQEAEEMYLRALQGYEKAWGPDHTLTLDTVRSLGILYANQGKLQEAEEMFLRALQGYEKAIGSQNILRYRRAITTTWNLGVLLLIQGNFIEAKRYHQRAHKELMELLGPSHKDVQSQQSALLDLYCAIEGGSMSIVGADMPTATQTQTRTRTQARKNRRRDIL